MKNRFVVILILFFVSCSKQETKKNIDSKSVTVPEVYTAKSSKDVRFEGDTVYVNNKKYAGFLFELYSKTNDTLSLEGYSEGLLSGVVKKWHQNKQLMEERYYTEGQKNGKQISFWENGHKKFEFIAKNDAYEGEMREWTIDGKLIHLATFENGQEEGTQKMWYDNGKIRANYVMVKGKRYGLLGTKNCRNVSDSIFVVK